MFRLVLLELGQTQAIIGVQVGQEKDSKQEQQAQQIVTQLLSGLVILALQEKFAQETELV